MEHAGDISEVVSRAMGAFVYEIVVKLAQKTWCAVTVSGDQKLRFNGQVKL
jgi:hypothetical protein